MKADKQTEGKTTFDYATWEDWETFINGPVKEETTGGCSFFADDVMNDARRGALSSTAMSLAMDCHKNNKVYDWTWLGACILQMIHTEGEDVHESSHCLWVGDNKGSLGWYELNRVMHYGATKYARDNWKLGLPDHPKYAEACIRHLGAHIRGDIFRAEDEESGLPHLGHALFYCFVSWWHLREIEEPEDEGHDYRNEPEWNEER